MGQPAPELEVSDHTGRIHSLAALSGRPVLVSFFRYAACPLCNLRVHAMGQHYERGRWEGLSVLAVFQSSAESIAAHVGRREVPFPLLADPGMVAYRRWGVELGWRGLLKAVVSASGDAWKAMRKGYFPGRIDGPIHRLPADFLVDANGSVSVAFYGEHIGDHLSFEVIDRFMEEHAGNVGQTTRNR
ncbi:peroxiredoxin-like family protein [Congregicoccus parvus]|uniref:peroxiredoxin-like family protein n=1 Tax=Congregicoccus parvus TaxID=3081749 RepID=UPI003FA5894B